MFKGIKQYNPEDCGTACLLSILRYHGIKVPFSYLKQKLSYGQEGANIFGIVTVAEELGLSAGAYSLDFDFLTSSIEDKSLALPLIAHVVRENGMGHFVIIRKIKNEYIRLFDPAIGNTNIKIEEFKKLWTGYVIEFTNDKENIEKINIRDKKYSVFFKELITNKQYILFVLFSSLIVYGLSYISTMFIRDLVDKHILKDSHEHGATIHAWEFISDNLYYIFLLIFLIIMIQLLFDVIKGFSLAIISKNINEKLSDTLYKRLIDIESLFFSRTKSGEVLTRFQSVVPIQQILINSLLTLTIESTSSIIGGVMLFRISPLLFCIVIFMIIVYGITVSVFIPKLQLFNKKYYTAYSDVLSYLGQTLSGIELIKFSNIKEKFINNFFDKIQRSAKEQQNIQKYGYVLDAFITFIENFGTILVFFVGANLINQKIITLGTLIAFQSLMLFFTSPIKKIILLQDELQNLSVIVNRINDILSYPLENSNEKTFFLSEIEKPEINMSNVSYSYGFKEPVVKNINLQISSGDRILISGYNGSGKSTLAKLISTLLLPTSGKYTINNVSVEEMNLHSVRKQIAYVNQHAVIFSGTLGQNLFMLDNNDELLHEVALECGLFDIAKHEQNILDMQVGENGYNLSSGEKQKISIARALLKKPKILILDEATSNIDLESENRIFNYILNKYDRDVILIIISHKFDHKLANKFIHIDEEGKIYIQQK